MILKTTEDGNKYYVLASDDAFHADHWSIMICEGEYEGVIYQYDTVKINSDDDNITFSTVTNENPDNLDLTKSEFVDIMKDILMHIIQEKYNEDREGDSPESGEQ